MGQLSEYLGPKETEKQLRELYLINTRLWLKSLNKDISQSIHLDLCLAVSDSPTLILNIVFTPGNIL